MELKFVASLRGGLVGVEMTLASPPVWPQDSEFFMYR